MSLSTIDWRFRSPASVLRVLGAGGSGSALFQELTGLGAVALADDSLGFVATDGDPGVFDAAVAAGAKLLNEAAGAGQRQRMRILVSPLLAEHDQGRATDWRDELAEDFSLAPPNLAGGAVWLTSRAASMLEDSWRLVPEGSYRRPSGKEIPLVRAEGPGSRETPWRNPTLLGRSTPWIPRPELEARLEDRLTEGLLLLNGPVGCGKTRLTLELLHRLGLPHVTLRSHARPFRESLASQLFRQTLQPPTDDASEARFRTDASRRRAAERWKAKTDPAAAAVELLRALAADTGDAIHVVCDDLHAADGDTLAFVRSLVSLVEPGKFRLWLVGRPDPRLKAAFHSAGELRIGPLETREHRALAADFAHAWSIPDGVIETLIEDTAGHPFALEEGIAAMARSHLLRRSYGSFFFAADDEHPFRFQPSYRLMSHIQAEAARLDLLRPLVIVSAAEGSLPQDDVESLLSGPDTPAGWRDRAQIGGLAQPEPSPWGMGVAMSCPAYARALASSLTDDCGKALRLEIGKRLVEHGGDATASWRCYRMLAGEPDALRPLLAASREHDLRSSAHFLQAIRDELAASRERGIDEGTERVLVWRLLQSARALGRLHDHLDELRRGLELARDEPKQLVALASLKVEVDLDLGRPRDAEKTIQTVLEKTEGRAPGDRRADLMIRLAEVYSHQDRVDEAEALLGNLIPAFRKQGLAPQASACRFLLGNLARRRRRLAEALAHHAQALDERRRQGAPARDVIASLSASGRTCMDQGDYPAALSHYDEAVALAVDDPSRDRDLSFALIGKGRVLGRLGDPRAARPLLRRALALREGRDDRVGEAIARLEAARNLLDLDQYESAFEEAGRARFQLELLSSGSVLGDADQLLGRIRLARRRFDEARQHFQAALETHTAVEDAIGAAFDEAWLVETAVQCSQASAADRAVRTLQERRAALRQVELSEQLDYRLYRGLSWLRQRGIHLGDPRPFLERAYEQVLAKAERLDGDQRHRFLFEVDENREVVEAASRAGLAG